MDSFKEAWSIICEYCRKNLTEVAYKTWISKIEPVKLDFSEGKAILMVPRATTMQSTRTIAKNFFMFVFSPFCYSLSYV